MRTRVAEFAELRTLDGSETWQIAPRDEKARRRSNVAPNQEIPISLGELARGVTLETLQALPVPVLAYGGQITIHGKAPAGELPTVFGRKSALVRNGNGSLGVMYSAIDAEKKGRIAEAVHLAGSETIYRATDGWNLSLYRIVETKEQAAQFRAEVPDGLYGSACLMRCPWTGTIFFVIAVGAVRESAMAEILTWASGKSSDEIAAAKAEKEREEKAQRDKWRREAEESNARHAAQVAEWKATEAETMAILSERLAGAVPVRMAKLMPGKFRWIAPASDRGPARMCAVTLEKRGPSICKLTGDQYRKEWRKPSPEWAEKFLRMAADGKIFPCE